MAYGILCGLILLAAVQELTAYNCTACDKRKCPSDPISCPSYTATDPCGCCTTCARQIWEPCGGDNWELGYCDHVYSCAAVNGTGLVQIPDVGVCKSLPTYSDYMEEDEICPEKYGCYIRTGICDCMTKRTCINDFRYSDYETCYRNTEYGYDPAYAETVKFCWNKGCNIIDGRCACQLGKCGVEYAFPSPEECNDALVSSRCGNITCPELLSPNCSSDSVASKIYTPDGGCCPTVPSFCTCDFDKCQNHCPHSRSKKLIISNATGVPGDCCDQIKCVQQTPEKSQQILREKKSPYTVIT